ncbi:cell envelope integrity/translocation protein TolA [Amylibacter marinus]|uniref:Cell envelope integrity/translocation protein TolA n=1 Tax=Amylibacter marinus TaxID=1475483 RepID=A0ABQ5VR21_9RHOB|nr:hypothetical protein [Amylibacter marinus]GLQ33780.1 cell envelope integrity/translocation protein TolA [Amylibacter marinus]
MDTGLKISASIHGAMIVAAIFGVPWFDGKAEATLKVSEVSLITSDEFAALQAGVIAPDEPAPAPEPKPEPVVVPQPDPEPLPEPIGEVDETPDAPVNNIAQTGQDAPENSSDAAPKPAETISDQVVEAPDEPVIPDTEVAVATTPTPVEKPAEAKPEEPDKPAAPKETTTEIVTEAEESISALAPARSSRPEGRPKNLRPIEPTKPEPEPVPAPEPDPVDLAKEIEDQIAKDIAAAIAQADAEAPSSTPAAVEGPPLSGSEKSGLVFSIQQCWNVPVGLKNDGDNVVTMKINLNREGRLEGEPTRVSPQSGSAAGILQAYEAARRALIRCQPYNLPDEKYETWREIEIVFNPRNMVLR